MLGLNCGENMIRYFPNYDELKAAMQLGNWIIF